MNRRDFLKVVMGSAAAGASGEANAALPDRELQTDNERRDLELKRFFKWFNKSKYLAEYERAFDVLTPEHQKFYEDAVLSYIAEQYREGVSPAAACARFEALHAYVYKRMPGDVKKRDMHQPTITFLISTLSLAAEEYLHHLRNAIEK